MDIEVWADTRNAEVAIILPNDDEYALAPDEARRLGDALVAAAREAGAISDIEQEICDSFDKGLG